MCTACGLCAVHCPSGAISLPYYTNEQINAMVEATTELSVWQISHFNS